MVARAMAMGQLKELAYTKERVTPLSSGFPSFTMQSLGPIRREILGFTSFAEAKSPHDKCKFRIWQSDWQVLEISTEYVGMPFDNELPTA